MKGLALKAVLVVGCGFAGATVARILAEAGIALLVIDKRPHIGGNAYDRLTSKVCSFTPMDPIFFTQIVSRSGNFCLNLPIGDPMSIAYSLKLASNCSPYPLIDIPSINSTDSIYTPTSRRRLTSNRFARRWTRFEPQKIWCSPRWVRICATSFFAATP